MLNNKDVFEKLMALLRSIEPDKSLPPGLEDLLWAEMMVVDYCYQETELEPEGKTPANAYYVVSGFVMVYAWCPEGYRYLYRIYPENTIVAFTDFVNQKISAYLIVACRNTRVWSISNALIKKIYLKMPEMMVTALNVALHFSEYMERLHSDLLRLNADARVLKFYTDFPDLNVARTSPVVPADTAAFLSLTPAQLKKAKIRLKKKKLIK
ncbi:MAG TPA: hypothetical protein VKB19_05220 [Pedobacter sp.]|nr:hypothetical protein [Pedobacter sp.]